MPKKLQKMKPIPISEKCLICLESFKETTDELAVQLICGHGFHYDCIMESYKMKTDRLRECPYCRKCGGYLPLLEGMSPMKNIHKEWKKLMDHKKYYGAWGQCKGICKNGDRCTSRAKYTVNGQITGFCGRHKSQFKGFEYPEPLPPTGPPVLKV